METATIARPYAEAVFKLAEQSSTLNQWSNLLATMATVAAVPEMQDAIGDPKLSDDQRYVVFAAACAGGLTQEAQNFARVLIENHRLGVLPEIYARYEKLKDKHEGVVNAEISSAFELNEAQIATLVAGLERRFKRKVNAKIVIDKELIGGVRMQVGDEVIDESMRGKLNAMAAALKN